MRFYKTREWGQKRLEILERDNYECQRCKAEGRFSPAVVVHHVQHLDRHPELALEDDNLLSLCEPCHNREHPEKLVKPEISKLRQAFPERW